MFLPILYTNSQVDFSIEIHDGLEVFYTKKTLSDYLKNLFQEKNRLCLTVNIIALPLFFENGFNDYRNVRLPKYKSWSFKVFEKSLADLDVIKQQRILEIINNIISGKEQKKLKVNYINLVGELFEGKIGPFFTSKVKGESVLSFDTFHNSWWVRK